MKRDIQKILINKTGIKGNYKPIIFQTEMVQANKEGRKSQTRRIIDADLKVLKEHNWQDITFKNVKENYWKAFSGTQGFNPLFKCPYVVGDILWVRETFTVYENMVQGSYPCELGEKATYPPHYLDKKGIKRCINYKADYPKSLSKWKPSIHMPAEAARIFLRLNKIRIEKLTDITKEDALSEGIEIWKQQGSFRFKSYIEPMIGFWEDSNIMPDGSINGVHPAIASYRTLFASINGFDVMMSDPYLWVYDYEILKILL